MKTVSSNKLSPLQQQVLVGTLLGDAHLRANKNKSKYQYVVLQSAHHKEYVFHLYEIFKNYTSQPPKEYTFKDKRFPGKIYTRWSFYTSYQECFRFYAHQFYTDQPSLLAICNCRDTFKCSKTSQTKQSFVKDLLLPITSNTYLTKGQDTSLGSVRSDVMRSVTSNTVYDVTSQSDVSSSICKPKVMLEESVLAFSDVMRSVTSNTFEESVKSDVSSSICNKQDVKESNTRICQCKTEHLITGNITNEKEEILETDHNICKRRKKVPKLIHRWLTPRAIAYWYMDDGAQKWKGKSLGVRFCTDNFTSPEIERLCKVLRERYLLKISLQKKGTAFRIYVSSDSYTLLKDLIFVFLIPSMLYKFPLYRDIQKVKR